MNFELCKSLCIDSSYEMFTDCLVLVKGKDFCFILSHFCFNNLQRMSYFLDMHIVIIIYCQYLKHECVTVDK